MTTCAYWLMARTCSTAPDRLSPVKTTRSGVSASSTRSIRSVVLNSLHGRYSKPIRSGNGATAVSPKVYKRALKTLLSHNGAALSGRVRSAYARPRRGGLFTFHPPPLCPPLCPPPLCPPPLHPPPLCRPLRPSAPTLLSSIRPPRCPQLHSPLASSVPTPYLLRANVRAEVERAEAANVHVGEDDDAEGAVGAQRQPRRSARPGERRSDCDRDDKQGERERGGRTRRHGCKREGGRERRAREERGAKGEGRGREKRGRAKRAGRRERGQVRVGVGILHVRPRCSMIGWNKKREQKKKRREKKKRRDLPLQCSQSPWRSVM